MVSLFCLVDGFILTLILCSTDKHNKSATQENGCIFLCDLFLSPDFSVFHTVESVKLPINSKAPKLPVQILKAQSSNWCSVSLFGIPIRTIEVEEGSQSTPYPPQMDSRKFRHAGSCSYHIFPLHLFPIPNLYIPESLDLRFQFNKFWTVFPLSDSWNPVVAVVLTVLAQMLDTVAQKTPLLIGLKDQRYQPKFFNFR